jgi:pimeloyl-ACP methyl ester carboxylesterase
VWGCWYVLILEMRILGEEERLIEQGVSGGGPSALALAYALPAHKLSAVSIVCGMGPPDIGMRGADIVHLIGWPYGIRIAPYWMGRLFWRSQTIGRLDLPEEERVAMMVKEGAKAPERDRDIFADKEFLRLSARTSVEAFRQGYDGAWDDGRVSCEPWGFGVQEIRKDLKVQLWYGKDDYFVPLNHGLQIAARLGANADLRVKDETHAGILMHWRKEILEGLRDMMKESEE